MPITIEERRRLQAAGYSDEQIRQYEASLEGRLPGQQPLELTGAPAPERIGELQILPKPSPFEKFPPAVEETAELLQRGETIPGIVPGARPGAVGAGPVSGVEPLRTLPSETLALPQQEAQQPFVIQEPAEPAAPGPAPRRQVGRGIYLMSLGLGQAKEAIGSASPREQLGGLMTFFGGLADISIPPEARNTIWGKIGPVAALIGTALNLSGRREAARARRSHVVQLQEEVSRALLGLNRL